MNIEQIKEEYAKEIAFENWESLELAYVNNFDLMQKINDKIAQRAFNAALVELKNKVHHCRIGYDPRSEICCESYNMALDEVEKSILSLKINS